MVGLIFGVVFLIAGIITCAILRNIEVKQDAEYATDDWGNKLKDSNGHYIIKTPECMTTPYKTLGNVLCVIGIFLCGLLTFFGCIANVGTGKTGVVTTFGKLENYTLESGFHMKAPWNKVTEIDTTINEIKFSTPAYTKDSQTVELEISVQYRISTTDTFNVIKDNGISDSQKHLQNKLQNRITSAVKTIVSAKDANELLINRSGLVSDLGQQLDSFSTNYYIIVASTNITNIDFTDEYEAAVAAKVAQQQAYEKALIEQQQALAAAENDKKIAETKAEAAAAVAKIQAQADMEVAKIAADSAEYQGKKQNAITLQALASVNGWTVIVNETSGVSELFKADGTQVTAQELITGTEKYIEYCYTQTWNGELPDTYVGDGNVSSILIGGTN